MVVVYDVGLVRRRICGVFVWDISCSAFVGFCGGIVMLPWCWLFGLDWIYCLCFGHCFKSLCCADCVCLVCYGYFVLVGLRRACTLKDCFLGCLFRLIGVDLGLFMAADCCGCLCVCGL